MQNLDDPSAQSGFLPSPVDSRLCPACKSMFTPTGFASVWSDDGYQHLDADACAASAAKGCDLCRLMLSVAGWGFRQAQLPLVFKAKCARAKPQVGTMNATASSSGGVRGNEIPLSMDTLEAETWYQKNKGGNAFFCRLAVVTSEDDPLSKHFPGRPLPEDMSSKLVFDAARKWLTECQDGHPDCAAQNERPLLPTRVLDVESTNNPEKLCLHVSKQKQHGEYVALSYCWGGPQPLVTTTENLDEMRKCIQASQLPQTLSDAVKVTRGLGIRYLWIDALCILQDSDDDKAHEIQNMGQVYKNATVTIIAGASKSAGEGFLKSRSPAGSTCDLDITAPDGTSGKISITPLVNGAFPNLPLWKRAWTFQEHLLSNRHLYYTDHELVWQCRTLKHATVAIGKVQYPAPTELGGVPFGMFHAQDSDYYAGSGGIARKQGHWRDILTSYSSRALANFDDRLNGITGVINELALLWEDECVFGIWKSRFIEELAWFVAGGTGVESMDVRSRRAPSWSWVSMEPPVQISSGWLDKVSDTELLSFLKGGREAVVRGKLLSSPNVPVLLTDKIYDREQTWGVMETDLDAQSSETETSFLLLGYEDDGVVLALALKPAGNDCYERIGLATFQEQNEEISVLWDQSSHQQVVLI